MSKLKVTIHVGKFNIENLKIEVEGTKEDAQIAQKVGQQFTEIIVPSLLTESSTSSAKNGTETNTAHTGSEPDKARGRRKSGGSGGSKASAEEIKITIDPTKHGSPTQDWKTVQKALWFLHVAKDSGHAEPLSGYSIAKNFNKHFKSSGKLDPGNVAKALEKERAKGTNSTVGVDTNDGTVRYFLTQTGDTTAAKLAKGDATSPE